MNHLAMAFPCLMYLASVGACSGPPQAGSGTLINTVNVAMGITEIYQGSGASSSSVAADNCYTSYLIICLSLHVLLTLMIVIRLIVHTRNLRKATGASDGSSGLHTAASAVATILVESYALYAVAFIVYIVPWAVQSQVANIFPRVVITSQVRSLSAFRRPTATLYIAV